MEKRDALVDRAPVILALIADCLIAYENAEDEENQHEWIEKAAEFVRQLQITSAEAIQERDALSPH